MKVIEGKTELLCSGLAGEKDSLKEDICVQPVMTLRRETHETLIIEHCRQGKVYKP